MAEARLPAPRRTLGVVVVHKPDRAVADLPAVRDLLDQVDELLVVLNGGADASSPAFAAGPRRWIAFDTNRGTAAAWNAAVGAAADSGCELLFILDQDSVIHRGAVDAALAVIAAPGVAAVVQPARKDILRLDPFPWNTVASGSLLDVAAVRAVGGFDERLFVDEVDHEVFSRLITAGYEVRQLPAPTIAHQTGSPRHISVLGRRAVVSGHGARRRRLQGFSAGVLARRYARHEPATAARLLLRHALTAAKDAVAGEGRAGRALVSGLVAGASTGRPPNRAAERACPYCEGDLVGRFGGVADWLFGTGERGDVYWCTECGALAAGHVPSPGALASWYARYYTHATEPERHRAWSGVWPTQARRREIDALHRFLSPPGATGRFLEVGTGAGTRLVEFADAGWDVVGQDLDPKAGHAAVERGIVVHRCPVENLVGTIAHFDLIGLSHVIEHAVEPAELLAACRALLAPNGRICVIAPNAAGLGRRLFGRWWYGLDQPRHLAIPTLESLERLGVRCDLDVVAARSAAANAAVVLGGSLARPVENRLPAGRLRRAGGFCAHLLGQAMGRAAVVVDSRLGEEVVWLGQPRRP